MNVQTTGGKSIGEVARILGISRRKLNALLILYEDVPGITRNQQNHRRFTEDAITFLQNRLNEQQPSGYLKEQSTALGLADLDIARIGIVLATIYALATTILQNAITLIYDMNPDYAYLLFGAYIIVTLVLCVWWWYQWPGVNEET